MRFTLVASLVAVVGAGCGDDKRPELRPDARGRIDAGNTLVDAPLGDSVPSDAAPLTLDCTSYCTAIQGACTGANEQYDDMADCMRACPFLPAGTLGMTTTNTLGCRISHATTARDDPSMAATACPAAGPSGDGTCGTTCDAFCAIIDDLCPGQWTAGQCATQCAARPALAGDYNSGTTVMSGDTRECRLYWATEGTCANSVRNTNPVCN